MNTIRVQKVVKVLLEDHHILSNWERLYDGLNIRDGSITQWRIGFTSGTMSSYTLFSNMMTTWLSAMGSAATMGTLSAILVNEGFVACAESIGEFGPNCKLVGQEPLETTFSERDGDNPVCSTGSSEGNLLLPLTSEELEVALQTCRQRDTIVLATETTYSGNFTLSTPGVCITSGGPGVEIVGKDPMGEVVTITGNDISISGFTIRSSMENCVKILGNNNKINECTLISSAENRCPALFIGGNNNEAEDVTVIGGPYGVGITGESNRLVNLNINDCGKAGCVLIGRSNSLVGVKITNVTTGLDIRGEENNCSNVSFERVKHENLSGDGCRIS